MRLEWSVAAADDIEAALDYIETDLGSPKAAEKLYREAVRKAELFAEVPGSGAVLRTVNGVDTGYRYMLCGNWMLFFRCVGERAIVVRFLYAKSDYMRKLFG